jgi:hypothetical protein
MIECCGKNICKKEQPQKKNNKSEQHKQCNPFQICTSCYGYIVVEFTIEKIIYLIFYQTIFILLKLFDNFTFKI